MMAASLRDRLWLSYALLIVGLLVVVATGVSLALLKNPRLLYPDAVFRIRLVSENASTEVEGLYQAAPERAERLLRRQAEARNVRLVLIDTEEKVTFDTGGADLPVNRILRADQQRPSTPDQVRTIRSRQGERWLYTLRRLTDGMVLLVMVPAPLLPLGVLLRDQFISAFLYSGLAALVLAFLMAFLLARWISAPLRSMISASHAVARGEYPQVPVEGPVEVQDLARAMNEMGHRVQASQQSQRDFLANVSHELKTPLTSIQGFAQALLDGTAHTPEALQQAAGVIYSETARMHRLVLDLLSLARLEAGTADLQHLPVDLEALLTAVLDQFALRAREAQVEIAVDLQKTPPVLGDGDRLAQVFTNLIDNALKFTPAGGRVTIALGSVDGGVQVSVRDTGPGIEADQLERVFERFYQVDRSRRGGTGRGVGLGLAIAHQIVIAHAGKIWVESHPGQGSCFMVKLPLARADNSSIPTNPKGRG